jgi:CRP-like cAMP-binding protein/HEAT repeat protein
MARLLEQAFGIRPEERSLVLSFFLFFVGVGMFYTVGSTVGDTLFLSSLPPQRVPRMLPWVYVGIAVTNVLSALTFGAVQERVSRRASIAGTQVLLAASVLGARELVESDADAVYFGLVIWLEVCALLSITLFFSFAGDYFAPRDARRLYGFIAGGMAAGTILAGSLIRVMVPFIGTKNLLYAGALLLAFNAAIALWIFNIGKPVAHAEPIHAEGEAERVSVRTMFSRPYVRLLALVIPIGIVVTVTVDYQMKWIASQKGEEALARFFGTFYGAVGIAQILFQFLLVPRLLHRLGIINCLMILPLLVGLGSAVLYGNSMLGAAGLSLLTFSAGVNFLRLTLSETLDLPSRELLFLPLPTRLRTRVQPLLSGAVAPAAQGLGGLLMLAALALGFGAPALSLIAIVGSGVLLVTLARLRPKYRETLAATLREHQLDRTDLEQVLQSPDAETLIAELLRSDDSEVVKATFGLLAGRELGTLGAVLEELVESPDPEVATGALERLAAERNGRADAAIGKAWESRDPAVRQAAVLALCEAAGERAMERVSLTLASRDEGMRSSAVIGLARHCGDAGQSLVRPDLTERASSDDEWERAEVARLLGRIGRTGFADLIAPLLRDPVAHVRLAAAEACAEMGDADLVEPLMRAMAEPDMRPAAMRALGEMPEQATGALAAAMTREDHPISERVAMARVLSRVAGVDAARALWEQTRAGEDLTLRLAAAEGLRAMRTRGRLPRIALDDLEARATGVCDAIDLLDGARRRVCADNPFVASIYGDHARLHIELLLCLLALQHDASAIDRIQFNLLGESRDLAVRTLDLFDEILPRRLAPRVVSTLSRWLEPDSDGVAADGGELEGALREGLLDHDAWVRVATVHHINQGAAYPAVEAARLSDGDRELYRLLDVVGFLKRVPLFRGLAAYHLLEQAEIAEWHAVGVGQPLFDQGDDGDALYIICQGAIEVRLGDRTLARLEGGECIGELALLDGEPRSAAAVAVQDTTLLKVDADRFKHLLVTQPATSRAVLRTLDRRIRETQTGEAGGGESVPPMRRSQFMRAQKLGLQQLVSTMSFLRQVDLFRDLSTPAMANLAGIAQEVVVYEGDTLFEEGDEGESLYLVCSGRIGIRVGERQVAELGRNACLGEMALISGLPRSASAEALSEGRLLRIGSEDFSSLLVNEPEIALALLQTLAHRLRSASRARREDG